MWLAFLKFEADGKVRTTHVPCPNRYEAEQVVAKALRRETHPGLKLVEYVLFYSRAKIYQKEASTFPEYTVPGPLAHGQPAPTPGTTREPVVHP
jgi:hypothetical protein